jgi:hypothetical protein
MPLSSSILLQAFWLSNGRLEGSIVALWHYGRGFYAGHLIHLLFETKRRDLTAHAKMKLRLHRKYSIKLMLAWESCRFDPFPPFLRLITDVLLLVILQLSVLGYCSPIHN